MKTKQTFATTSNPQQPTAAQLAGGLIISVGEARKILGADAKNLSDEEIIQEVYLLNDAIMSLLKLTVSRSQQ